MVHLLKVPIRASLVGLNARIVELWVMWFTSVISCMVIHLGTSSRIRVSKVEVHPLLTMWLQLIIVVNRL